MKDYASATYYQYGGGGKTAESKQVNTDDAYFEHTHKEPDTEKKGSVDRATSMHAADFGTHLTGFSKKQLLSPHSLYQGGHIYIKDTLVIK